MEEFLSTLGVVAVVLFAVTAAVVLLLIYRLVRRHRAVHRPETPFRVKFGYWASIAYAVVPVDLLPDPVLVDDIGVLAAGVLYVGHATKKLRRSEDRP